MTFILIYIRINTASKKFEPDLEYIYYISLTTNVSSFYYPLLLAPIKMSDNTATINQKIALVSRYIETFIVRKKVNSEPVGHALLHDYCRSFFIVVLVLIKGCK